MAHLYPLAACDSACASRTARSAHWLKSRASSSRNCRAAASEGVSFLSMAAFGFRVNLKVILKVNAKAMEIFYGGRHGAV